MLPAIPRQFADLQPKAEAEDSDNFVYGGTVRDNTYRPVSKVSPKEATVVQELTIFSFLLWKSTGHLSTAIKKHLDQSK